MKIENCHPKIEDRIDLRPCPQVQFSTISRFEATINCGDRHSSTVLYLYIYDAQYILCCLDGVHFRTAGTNTRKIAMLSVLPCRLCYSQNHNRTMGHQKIADIYISTSMETFEHRKYKIRGDEGIN